MCARSSDGAPHLMCHVGSFPTAGAFGPFPRLMASQTSPTVLEETPSQSQEGSETLEMGPPTSVGNMAPELLVLMFKLAMAPDIARLEERLDLGDTRFSQLEDKIDNIAKQHNVADERFQKREALIEKLSEHLQQPLRTTSPGGRRSCQGIAAASSPSASTPVLSDSVFRSDADNLIKGLATALFCFDFRGPLDAQDALYVRGWSPYGAPPFTKISRSEADLLDDNIRNITGELYDYMAMADPPPSPPITRSATEYQATSTFTSCAATSRSFSTATGSRCMAKQTNLYWIRAASASATIHCSWKLAIVFMLMMYATTPTSPPSPSASAASACSAPVPGISWGSLGPLGGKVRGGFQKVRRPDAYLLGYRRWR